LQHGLIIPAPVSWHQAFSERSNGKNPRPPGLALWQFLAE
jgi:hypothetical protein